MVQATGPLQSRVHAKLVDNEGNLISDTPFSQLQLKRVPLHLNSTGTGLTLRTLAPGAAFKLLGIKVHIGTGAPLAAAETLTVTLDSGEGAAYDVVLFTLDMGTPSINDVVIPFGGEDDFYQADDAIVIALSANAGGDTWGCETIHELV